MRFKVINVASTRRSEVFALEAMDPEEEGVEVHIIVPRDVKNEVGKLIQGEEVEIILSRESAAMIAKREFDQRFQEIIGEADGDYLSDGALIDAAQVLIERATQQRVHVEVMPKETPKT